MAETKFAGAETKFSISFSDETGVQRECSIEPLQYVDEDRKATALIFPKSWSDLSEDVLRSIFLYSPDINFYLLLTSVCRNWRRAIDRPGTWHLLSKVYSWPLMSKREFLEHARAVTRFEKGAVHKVELKITDSLGVAALKAPPRRQMFSWAAGREITIDPDIVVVGKTDMQEFEVWNLQEKKRQRQFSFKENGKNISWSQVDMADDIVCMAGKDMRLIVADLSRGAMVHSSDRHSSTITSLKALPAPYRLVASGAYDATLRVWDTRTAACLYTFNEGDSTVWSVDLHPNGTFVAAGFDSGLIRVHRLPAPAAEATAPYPDDHPVVECKGHDNTVMALQFDPVNPDQLLWSSSYDCTARLWHHPTGQCVRVLSGHTGVVFSMTVFPHVVVTGSRDKTIRVWDRLNGRCLREKLEGHTAEIKAVVQLGPYAFASAGYDGKVIAWRMDQPTDSTTTAAAAASDQSNCVVM